MSEYARQVAWRVWLLVVIVLAGYAIASNSPEIFLIGTVACVGSWLLVHHRKGQPLPRFVINLMVLALLIWVSINYKFEKNYLLLMGNFLAYLLMLKMFDQQRSRDWVQVLMLSLFLMMCGSILSATLIFGILLIVYLMLSVVILLHVQILHAIELTDDRVVSCELVKQRTRQETVSHAGTLRDKRVRRNFTGVAFVGFVLSSLMAAGVFYISPRISEGNSFGNFDEFLGRSQSGFTTEVTLGGTSTIFQNEQPVMNVVLMRNGIEIGDIGKTFHLRGAVLDQYRPNTKKWRRGKQFDKFKKDIDLELNTDPQLVSNINAFTRTSMHITGRKLFGKEIFTGYNPIELRLGKRGDIRFNTDDQLVRFVNKPRDLLNYEVDMAWDVDRDLYPDYQRRWEPGAPSSASIDLWYLPRNPILDDEPRVRALAVDILNKGGITVSEEQLPAEHWAKAASLIQQWLEAECRYTLDQPDMGVQEPISAFLLDKKLGHCEYFASGFCALLRSLYVPARMVTGYNVSEYNSLGQYYVVRESDAHAWVEVYVSGKGWVTFDPAPRVDALAMRNNQAGLWARMKQLYDLSEFYWISSIVAFDAPDQEAFFSAMRSMFSDVGHQLESWFGDKVYNGNHPAIASRSTRIIIGVVVIVFILGIIAYFVLAMIKRFSRKRMKRMVGLDNGHVDPKLLDRLTFYYNMLKLLDKRGFVKSPSQTPRAFADSLIEKNVTQFGDVSKLTQLYYQIRYGQFVPDAVETTDIKNVLLKMKREMR